ncbi:DUF5825 family protein [Streptomyces sp. BH106]|uniref:DUF5825 family protein n=1 Tax=Streptomyces sp. BH106 TaxID=3410409 RepID=UPI003CEE2715
MTALPALVPHRVIGTRVRVTEPLPLHGDGRATTRAVQFLRECQAAGLSTHWEAVTVPRHTYDGAKAPEGSTGVTYDGLAPAAGVTYDGLAPAAGVTYDGLVAANRVPYNLRTLHHLPPPAQQPDESGELTAWRAEHAYGMLYHRRGPGFVTVMDRRERPASARFTLDHPDLLAAFDALSDATPLDTLAPAHREAALHLAEEELALIVDGWAVALPPRMHRWPVPCMGI